jgi:hypothetical protein
LVFQIFLLVFHFLGRVLNGPCLRAEARIVRSLACAGTLTARFGDEMALPDVLIALTACPRRRDYSHPCGGVHQPSGRDTLMPDDQLTPEEIADIAAVVARLARGRGAWFDADAAADRFARLHAAMVVGQ